MAEEILYLTELLGLKVYDLRGRVLGRIRDAALVPRIHPTRIDRYLIGGPGIAWMNVRWDQVKSISLDGIHLKDETLTPYHADEYMLRLERDLLDQQIIDAQGRKVVRVNDVTFAVHHDDESDTLSVLEVDIGLRSVFRRLAQGVVPRRGIRRLQRRIAPNSISWELCNILEPDPQRRLRLNISTALLEKMHPADLADIVEDLNPENREALIESIHPETAADVLEEMEPEEAADVLEELETEKAADILEEMEPDDAADVISELEDEASEEILEEMESEQKAEVEELLEHDEDSAGGLMSPLYLAVHEDATAADAIDALRSEPDLVDVINTIFVTDVEGRLRGAIPAARVFLARPDSPISEMITEEPVSAPVDEPAERIYELFDKYSLLTLPVVDEDGRLAGAVTADDIISALRDR